MADRTPIDIARRAWPGEWKIASGVLHRILSVDPLILVSVSAFVLLGRWCVVLDTPGWRERIASDIDLAEALATARQKLALAVAELARTVGDPKEPM